MAQGASGEMVVCRRDAGASAISFLPTAIPPDRLVPASHEGAGLTLAHDSPSGYPPN
jgi:hypothetical protein